MKVEVRRSEIKWRHPRSGLSKMWALIAIVLVVVSGSAAAYVAMSLQRHIRPMLVTIELYGFSPGSVTVVLGVNNTITWTNGDPDPHTVADDARSLFYSGQMDPHINYTFTFASPGVYNYFCTYHPFMVGTVIVMA